MNAEELRLEVLRRLHGVDNAEQESGWIVSRAAAIPVMEFFFQKRPLDDSEIQSAYAMTDRRLNGEPLQYILGDEYFGELLLKVGPGCLIPRPETFGIVETLLPQIPRNGTFCELGVGSGAISLSLAYAREDLKVYGSELSPDALRWAQRNLAAYEFKNVEFRSGSLFEPFPGMRFDAVAANLPYIPREEKPNLQREVRDFEPDVALFADDGGTALIRRAIRQLDAHLVPGGIAMFEMGAEQTRPLLKFAASLPFLAESMILKDCFGIPRFLFVKKA